MLTQKDIVSTIDSICAGRTELWYNKSIFVAWRGRMAMNTILVWIYGMISAYLWHEEAEWPWDTMIGLKSWYNVDTEGHCVFMKYDCRGSQILL